jgi:hypothetical protein
LFLEFFISKISNFFKKSNLADQFTENRSGLIFLIFPNIDFDRFFDPFRLISGACAWRERDSSYVPRGGSGVEK